jgi:hypothetical protein
VIKVEEKSRDETLNFITLVDLVDMLINSGFHPEKH